MGLKDLPYYSLPREKADRIGIENLTDEELIALILGTGTKSENVLVLSKRLIDEKGGLKGLLKKDYLQLKTSGLNRCKIYRILAIKEIVSRYNSLEEKKLVTSKDIYEYFQPKFSNFQTEHLLVLYLSIGGSLLHYHFYTQEEYLEVMFSSKEVIREAIKYNAFYVILAHNHPSGNLLPSDEDIRTANRMKKYLKENGCILKDSLIISDKSYYSLRENGLFER